MFLKMSGNMDKFSEYLKKIRSEQFFFIKNYTLAVLRFSNRTEIVDIATGEVQKVLKVKYISEAVYCGRYDKLYLKSIGNGYVYVYDFAADSLKKLFKLAESDNGIFLSYDEEKLIAYTFGYIYEIETKTDERRLLYEAEIKCLYGKGWDNPNKKCYEFIYVSGKIPCTLLSLSYEGKIISEEVVRADEIPFFINDIVYSVEYDLYIMHGFKHYIMANIDPEGKKGEFCIISKSDINNFAYISEEKYGGGCHDILIYKNYAVYCYGDMLVKTVDMNTLKLMEVNKLNRTITKMQYDPSRNTLYVSTGNSCKNLSDFFD